MTDLRPTCAEGVPPEDVAAWALDGEEYLALDLVGHVPDCAACRNAVAGVSGSRGVGDVLRAAAPVAPVAVAERAVGRIRTEATMLTVLRALGGGWLRVVQAVPDYARGREPSRGSGGAWLGSVEDDPGDTGEFPAPQGGR